MYLKALILKYPPKKCCRITSRLRREIWCAWRWTSLKHLGISTCRFDLLWIHFFLLIISALVPAVIQESLTVELSVNFVSLCQQLSVFQNKGFITKIILYHPTNCWHDHFFGNLLMPHPGSASINLFEFVYEVDCPFPVQSLADSLPLRRSLIGIFALPKLVSDLLNDLGMVALCSCSRLMLVEVETCLHHSDMRR